MTEQQKKILNSFPKSDRGIVEAAAEGEEEKTAEVMADLPKNATGKVLKTELRAPYWEGRSRSVG